MIIRTVRWTSLVAIAIFAIAILSFTPSSDAAYLGGSSYWAAVNDGLDITNTNSGYVGIGTSSPATKLHVIGTIRTDLTGTSSRCLYVNANGDISAKTTDCGTATGGDDLGSHIATQNIQLGSHWLSGDNGNEGIFVDSSGYVGIGTNTPANMLYVAKNMTAPEITIHNLGGSGGSGFRFIDDLSDSDFRFKAVTSGGFKIRDNTYSLDVLQIENNAAANALYIKAGGNVGLSTSSPDSLLQVGTNFHFTSGGTLYNIDSSRWLDMTGVQAESLRVPNDIYSTAGELKADGTGNSYVMGRLGVGLSNPATSMLQVLTTGSGFTHQRSAGGYFYSTGFNSNDPYFTYYGANGLIIGYGATTGGAPTVNTLTLLSGGNVGVGITNPGTRLDVFSSATAGNNVKIQTVVAGAEPSATVDFWLQNTSTGGSSGKIEAKQTDFQNNALIFSTESSNAMAERMRIHTNGYLGVGTSSPAERLEVNGAVFLDPMTAPAPTTNRLYNVSGNLFWNGTQLGAGGTGDSNWVLSGSNLYASSTSWNVGIGVSSPQAKLDILANNVALGASYATPGNLVIHTSNTLGADIGGSISLGGKWATSLPDNIASFARLSGRKEGSVDGAAGGYLAFEISRSDIPYISERMRITSTGNVGISTTSPDSLLQVGANFHFSSGGILYNVDSSRWLDMTGVQTESLRVPNDIYSTAGELKVAGTGDSYVMGRLGIGTTIPRATLNVATSTGGSTLNPVLRVQSMGSGLGSGPSIDFVNIWSGAGTWDNWIQGRIGSVYDSSTNNGGALVFYTNNSGAVTSPPTEKIRINPAGYLGIGTTNPTALLHTNVSDSSGVGLLITGKSKDGTTDNSYGAMIALSHNSSGNRQFFIGNSESNIGLRIVGNAIDAFNIATQSTQDLYLGNTYTNIIKADGKVGIGTDSPATKLQVVGTIRTDLTGTSSRCLYVDTNGDIKAKTTDCGTASGGDDLGSHIATQNIQLGSFWLSGDGGNEGVFVSGAGDVGIGTTAPGAKLQVETSVAGPIATFKNTSNNYGGLILRMDNSGQANSRNWGIFTDAGAFGNLSFAASTNSTSTPVWSDAKITFNKDGNVGIGATNPTTAKLVVTSSGVTPAIDAGNYTIRMNYTPLVASDVVNLAYLTSTLAADTFWGGTTGGSIWNLNAGNIGIGTTDPTSKFQIAQHTNGVGTVSGTAGSPTLTGVGTKFLGDFHQGATITIGSETKSIGNVVSDTSLTLNSNLASSYTDATFTISGTGAARIDGNSYARFSYGSVLTEINSNNNGAYGLRTSGAVKGNGFYLYTTTGGFYANNGTPMFYATATNNFGVATILPTARLHVKGVGATGTSSTFKVDNSADTNLLTILDSGYVGIGTTSPAEKLEVNGAIFLDPMTAPSPTTNRLYNVSGNLFWNGTQLGSGGTGGDSYWRQSGSDLAASSTAWNVAIGTTTAGAYKLYVQGDANITGNLTVNKLTVNTVDPLYRIGGVNYSTFGASISGGVKEEYIGRIKVNKEAVIDFDKVSVGSDLWVWRQVVDFSPANVEVLLTPYGGFAQAYYLIEGNKLIFRSDRPTELSYRLIGKRFDWQKWPTLSDDQTTLGLEVK